MSQRQILTSLGRINRATLISPTTVTAALLLLFLITLWINLQHFGSLREAALAQPLTYAPEITDTPQTAANAPASVPFDGLGYPVFGEPEQNLSTSPVPEELPITKLQLNLSGTFGHSDANTSSAIIATPGQTAEQYFLGDTLPGGAQLHSIHRDAVVLKTADGLETLFLAGHIALGASNTHRSAR